MKTKTSLILAGLLSTFVIGAAYAAGSENKMDMKAMEQQMTQQLQKIVNEPLKAQRQALMDEQIKQMQPHMQMCQQMMGS